MTRKKIGGRCLIIAMAGIVLATFVGLAKADDAPLLLDRHKAAGLTCASCHKEKPPRTKSPNKRCLDCHGGQEKLAAKTSKVTPNPHAPPHLAAGDVQACDDCHHIHQPSEVACADCHHGFHFNVK